MAKERRRGAGAVCSLRAVFPDTPLTLSRLSYAGVISRRALVVLEESLPDALVMGRAHCVRDGLAISWEQRVGAERRLGLQLGLGGLGWQVYGCPYKYPKLGPVFQNLPMEQANAVVLPIIRFLLLPCFF